MLFGSVFMFRDPGLSTPYDQLVREMREYVLLMEELGFDYLWLGEHHLGLEGFGNSPNPLLVAADMASRTKNLRFGFACLVPTLWHPLRLAEDIATLDHLTEGRIEIGFGRGPWPRDTVPLPPQRRPQRRGHVSAADAGEHRDSGQGLDGGRVLAPGRELDSAPAGDTVEHPLRTTRPQGNKGRDNNETGRFPEAVPEASSAIVGYGIVSKLAEARRRNWDSTR